MIFGQDKAIFQQFVFSKGVWILPVGRKQLVPKDDGQGVMLLSLVSQKLRYVSTLTSEVKAKVNTLRTGKHYSDIDPSEKRKWNIIKK